MLTGRMSESRPAAALYRRLILAGLRAYKLTLSPLIGTQCRFAPSCSEYAAQALIAHGPARGAWLATRRVCRCNPWGGSGYDPVPHACGGRA